MSKIVAQAAARHNAAVQPAPPTSLTERLRQWYRRWRRAEPIADADALRTFLGTRSSRIAQLTLYGYLRTPPSSSKMTPSSSR